MSKMMELYDKVTADFTLQEKFLEIINSAPDSGSEITGQKLSDFAKDAGYEISLDEMKAFFEEMAESKEDALTESELDMVAGGKGNNNITRLFNKTESQMNKWINDPAGMLKRMF